MSEWRIKRRRLLRFRFKPLWIVERKDGRFWRLHHTMFGPAAWEDGDKALSFANFCERKAP